MKQSDVDVELWAGEIIPPGGVIKLRFARPVNACHGHDQGKRQVRVLSDGKDQDVYIKLGKDGLQAEVHLPPHLSGPCELLVRALEAADGQPLRANKRVPFSVVPVSRSIVKTQRIASAVRVRLGETSVERLKPGAAGGRFVDVMKVLPRDGEGRRELAIDDAGNPVDFAKALTNIEAQRASKFGKIHESLFELIKDKDTPEDKLLDVDIWANVSIPAAPYLKPTQSDEDTSYPYEAEKVSAEVCERVDGLRALLSELDVKEKPVASEVGLLPFIQAQVTVAQLRFLAQQPQVGGLFLDDPEVVADLATSVQLSRADLVHEAGVLGAGVRVAVWEDGPDTKSELKFEAEYRSDPPTAGLHARLTSAVIKHVRAGVPGGYAPACSLYSANESDVPALSWAAAIAQCTVINQSFHWHTQAGSAIQLQVDLWSDYQTTMPPHPLIVQSAGNFGQDSVVPEEAEFVNHKGFNSITVGGHGEGFELAKYSVRRNPLSSHGDRELPMLTASGRTLDAEGTTYEGTSFAAPAVAGVAALLQSISPTLRAWPEACRAILMAAAHRGSSHAGLWQDISSGRDVGDGAGALDADAALTIARARRLPANAGARAGWDVINLSSASFGADGLILERYTLEAPDDISEPVARVCVCWGSRVTSSNGTPTHSELSVDLDLLVLDGQGKQVAGSASWDNSYELAQFYPEAGGSYQIVIHRASGSEPVWCGLAWIVTSSAAAID